MDPNQQEKSCTSDIELEQLDFGSPPQNFCAYQQSKVNNHFLSPSEVFRRIDGFATIQGYDFEEEENLMNNIQINNEFKDFHLEKMFDEHSRFFQESQLDLNNFNINHQKNHQNDPKPQQQQQQQQQPKSRKGSQQLPSFQDLLDRMIENFIDSFSPNSFQEYSRYQEAMGNIDNFIFLEQSLQFPYVFKNFIGHYMRFIEKMKQYRQQGRLDFKQMISFVCSMGLEYIQDVLNVIRKCDSAYCFQILKEEKDADSTLKVPQRKQETKQETDTKLVDDQFEEPKKKPKNPSNGNEKSARKNWTEAELQLLEDFINNCNSGAISQQQIHSLCQQLGRSVYSVQSKIQKMRKQDTTGKSMQIMSSDVTSSASFKQKQSTRYDYSIDDMIRISLRQLRDMRGTKPEILQKIKQTFFDNGVQADFNWERSVSQVLSSNKTPFIKKIKGTFSLSPFTQFEDDDSLKSKLYGVLEQFPKKRAPLGDIFKYYLRVEQFESLDENQMKILKKRVNQTLLQSNIFEKSQAKTLYCLVE